MKRSVIKPALVEFIPEHPEDGIIYISQRFRTASHKCCCGCGEEVVTPLTPAGWSVALNGSAVSLSPSIGNWDFTCRSHYLIIDNQVIWASALSQRQIELVKSRDKADIEAYIMEVNLQKEHQSSLWYMLVKLWQDFTRWLRK